MLPAWSSSASAQRTRAAFGGSNQVGAGSTRVADACRCDTRLLQHQLTQVNLRPLALADVSNLQLETHDLVRTAFEP